MRKVNYLDVCSLVLLLYQAFGTLEPEELRLEVAWFYVTFLKKDELVENFFVRLQQQKKNLRQWGHNIDDRGFDDAYRVGFPTMPLGQGGKNQNHSYATPSTSVLFKPSTPRSE